MKKNEEFYVGYSDKVGQHTKKKLKQFVAIAVGLLLLGSLLFSFFQQPAANSSFDFGNPTKISGTYHESPYPMLKVPLAEGEFKEIVLLGFGKSGANPYLDEAKEKYGSLIGKTLAIEGQLIYYNGKTLLEIDDSQKITVTGSGSLWEVNSGGDVTLEGEIVDPKCYFGVMKPGYGKIHRSCAALCIAGGIPPVLVSKTETGEEDYFLLVDVKGKPIHKDIIPYIGQPIAVQGEVAAIGDWKLLHIAVDGIVKTNKASTIY